MLGLVVGPGEELGVGLVVLGVSVPLPPMPLLPMDDPLCDSAGLLDAPLEVSPLSEP